MKKFTEIKDKRQLEDLKDFSADFHDGRVIDMNCKISYSNKNNVYDEWYTLKIRIDGVYFAKPKYKPESVVVCESCKYNGIELLFERIDKMFFNPNSTDYLYIYEALLMIKDGKFLFNAFSDEQELVNLDTTIYMLPPKNSVIDCFRQFKSVKHLENLRFRCKIGV